MKKYLCISAMLVAFTGHSKELPKPSVLLTITEKILIQAQLFVFPEDKEILKPVKIKPTMKEKVKPVVKAEPALTEKLSIRVYRDGMWILTEN